MTAGRFLILTLTFFLDVHVRAAVVIKSGDQTRLVSGQTYVEGSSIIVTPFARFTCAGTCAAIFSRDDVSVTIESLSSGWSLVRTGDQTSYAVDPATFVRVGEVAPDGRAVVEPPLTTPWATLIHRWAALYPGNFEDFRAKVNTLRPVWTAAVERLSLDQAGRAVAMQTQDQTTKDRAARAAQARAAEDEELRRLFRERNHVAP